MAMDCVTEENVEKLIEQYTDKQKQLDVLKNTTIEQMWISELNALKIEYEKHREQLQISIGGNNTKVKSVKKIKLVKKSVK